MIWDFDFACIPEIVPNLKVEEEWTTKININPEKNRYYDLHYFFNTLQKKAFFPQILTEPEIPTEIKEFVQRVVPKRYTSNDKYVANKGRILCKKEYTTPDKLLREDPLFKEFRLKEE